MLKSGGPGGTQEKQKKNHLIHALRVQSLHNKGVDFVDYFFVEIKMI